VICTDTVSFNKFVDATESLLKNNINFGYFVVSQCKEIIIVIDIKIMYNTSI